MNVFQIVKQLGIVPVISIPEEALAEPLAAALIEGGIPLIEVTLRNDCALGCIRRIKQAFPNMCVGAGTVVSIGQAEAAKASGADFIVSPGFDGEVVKLCIALGIPVLPGCVTPTEISAGMKLGLDVFKFFPSESLGGVNTMKELGGPYKSISFVATSGVTMKNLGEYLSCEKVTAVGGSFVAPANMVLEQNWAGITALCREAIRISLNFHLAHIGINGANDEDGESRAKRFAQIFDIPYKKGNRSDFAGTLIESCKMKFPGFAGHIAIGTRSVERAEAYLKSKGIGMRKEFINRDAQGKLIAVYLEEEIAGFAIHLLEKQ